MSGFRPISKCSLAQDASPYVHKLRKHWCFEVLFWSPTPKYVCLKWVTLPQLENYALFDLLPAQFRTETHSIVTTRAQTTVNTRV